MAITQPTKALTRLLWVALIIIIGGVSFFGWSSDYGVGDFALPSTLKETETAGYQEIGDVDLFVKGASPVSYDKTTPPGTGCEAIVAKSQSLLIEAYTKYFKGIRYVNLWGYLETGNKGDAAIWNAQQIMLATLGITPMETCRFIDNAPAHEVCNMTKYTAALKAHEPHSAIVAAGGGNFNDFYWQDQPQRLKVANYYPEYPLRMFPQSIWMTHADRIEQTREDYHKHPNVQLGARDQPSYDWLEKTFGPSEKNGPDGSHVMRSLTPDIVYTYGNRPDYRLNTKKEYDILIMPRHDLESMGLNADSPDESTGTLQLGKHKVTYLKKDWDDIPATDLTDSETGKNQRAHLKAEEGFKILGRAEFVITDKLHGHIMSSIIGTPHVLLDSKLGKNFAYHDTWTVNCNCVRTADDYAQSLEYATMWFEKAFNEGRWKPAVDA